MPPEKQKLITFANYSNPSSSFVNIKVRYIPKSFLVSYHQNTVLNLGKLLHNMVLTNLGWIIWEATYVKEFIAWIQRTSNVFILKMMLSTADLWARNDISYGGHFCRMENPMTIKA